MIASNTLRPYRQMSYALETTGGGYRVDIFNGPDGGARIISSAPGREFDTAAEASAWAREQIAGLWEKAGELFGLAVTP